MPAGLLMIDVSSLQGAIDWNAVAAWRSPDGRRVVGVVARATNGTSPDSRHHSYRDGARKAGLRFGSYGVIYPGGDVAAQARAFLGVVGQVDDDELPPMLDWEVHGGAREHAAAVQYLAIVEPATRRQWVIYTGIGFTSAVADWPKDSPLISRPLWVAHYTSAQHPLVPSQWQGRFCEWQYSGNGGEHVGGIAVDVDRDVFVEDVNADGKLDEQDVAAFIARSKLANAPVTLPSPAPAPVVVGTIIDAQRALLALGYALPRWGADGIYGGETGHAVASFQSAHGIAADGVLNAATYDALTRELAHRGDT